MKKLFRTVLCAALMAAALSISAFAAEGDAIPERQGDFYVLVNGEYVTFSDAVPQLRDSRSYLPFVAVFDQLGYAEEDMTWDGTTGTVTATKGDTTISLVIGEKQITLTRDGEDTVIPVDVAPYVDPATNRTYIPFGLAAQVLDYKVGWDASNGTVLIDDVDAILAENDATYDLMDKYLDYSRTYAEKNYQITGSYNMAMDMAGTTQSEGQDMDLTFGFGADGDYDMITAGSTAFQFDTDMALDMSMTMNGVDVLELAQAMEGAPVIPESLDFDMRGDLETGVLYYQSAALAELLEQPELADVWYQYDMKAMFDQMSGVLGMDYATLMRLSTASLEMSFADALEQMLRAMPLTSAQATTGDYLALINAICADSAFEKSGSRYVNTFVDADGVQGTFTLYTSGSKVNGYAMELTAEDETGIQMSLDASMRSNEMQMSMSMAMEDADVSMSMEMTMDGTYRATSTQPETEPPAGAQILDLTQMMQPPAESV